MSFYNFAACGQKPMMRQMMRQIMILAAVMAVVSCNRTDYAEPFERRIKDYDGTFVFKGLECKVCSEIDLNGDGVKTDDMMAEFRALDKNSSYLESSKVVSIPALFSNVNTALIRIPVQRGFLEDGDGTESWARLGLTEDEIVYEFDNHNNVSYYLPSEFRASNDPLSHYESVDVQFKDGQVRYRVNATFYDFARKDYVTCPVTFIFERE